MNNTSKKYMFFDKIIGPFYGLTQKEFIEKYYFENKMSDIEIVEMIERDLKYRFSRMAIQKWRAHLGLESRGHHDRFQLAVNKKRFDHHKVAKKIDYKKRTEKIDYKARNLTEGYKNRFKTS